MPRFGIMLVACSIVAASGLGHGLLTDRWGLSPEPQRSADKLADLPLVVGNWQGQDLEMSPEEFHRAGINGYIMRRYVNRQSRDEVQVLLVCGRPGHVAVHSPEVCFQGEGYNPGGRMRTYSLQLLSGPAADFRVADFVKERGLPDQLRIFWSFGSAETWSAPQDARLAFVRKPALFKLYVIRHLPKLGDPLDKDLSVEFLRSFLPEVQKCLFARS